jgi:hypothetical protein
MMLLGPILAGSATAAGAAGAVGSAAGAVGSGFSLAGALSGGLSIVSGLASIAQGRAESAQLLDKSAWESFNEKREVARGRSETIAALRAGNEAIAAAQVAGFASGLQSSGSVMQAKLDAARDTEFNVGMARDEAAIAAGARRGEAARLKRDAGWARFSGWTNALGTWGGALGRFRSTG